MESYEKPCMEIIRISGDVIITSCPSDCPLDGWNPCPGELPPMP